MLPFFFSGICVGHIHYNKLLVDLFFLYNLIQRIFSVTIFDIGKLILYQLTVCPRGISPSVRKNTAYWKW